MKKLAPNGSSFFVVIAANQRVLAADYCLFGRAKGALIGFIEMIRSILTLLLGPRIELATSR